MAKLSDVFVVMLAMLCPAASFATVIPTPPYPGASPSLAYQVAVDRQLPGYSGPTARLQPGDSRDWARCQCHGHRPRALHDSGHHDSARDHDDLRVGRA